MLDWRRLHVTQSFRLLSSVFTTRVTWHSASAASGEALALELARARSRLLELDSESGRPSTTPRQEEGHRSLMHYLRITPHLWPPG